MPSEMEPGSPEHVALWDAINEYAAAWGGPVSLSTERMRAVAKVETALRAAWNRPAPPSAAARCERCRDTKQVFVNYAPTPGAGFYRYAPGWAPCPDCAAAAREEPARCENCGAPATCLGAYEGSELLTYSCDDCCGHGNEDGHCEPVATGRAGGGA